MLYGPYRYDSGLSLGGSITAADLAGLARDGFRMLVNNRPDGEMPGQLPSEELEKAARSLRMGYAFIPFRGAQLTPEDVRAFGRATAGPGPALAVCATGTRCALIAAARDVARGDSTDTAIRRAQDASFDLGGMQSFLQKFAPQRAA